MGGTIPWGWGGGGGTRNVQRAPIYILDRENLYIYIYICIHRLNIIRYESMSISHTNKTWGSKILTPISDLFSWKFCSFWRLPWVLSYPVAHVPPSHGTPPGSQSGLLKSNSFNSCAVATVSSERPKKPSWLVSSCWNLKELARMPSYTCRNIFKICRVSF